MKKFITRAVLALTICFNVSISGVTISMAVPTVATVTVLATLPMTQMACSKDQLVASAEDVLSVVTDQTLIKALQTLSPPMLQKIEALVPTAKDLITAIKNGDTSTALNLVNTIFPVIEEAFALFNGGNPG